MENNILIENVWVVSVDDEVGEIKNGSILVEGSKIKAVGTNINPTSDYTIIDGTGFIAIPGLIDSHKHLWHTPLRGTCLDTTLLEYFIAIKSGLTGTSRPKDVAFGTYAGAIESISSGITSVFDHAHCLISPEHSDCVAEAIIKSGIRGVWGYGFDANGIKDTRQEIKEVKRIKATYFSDEQQLLSMGIAVRPHNSVPFEQTIEEIKTAMEMGIIWTAHTHCGNGPGPLSRGIHKLYANGFLNKNALLSHCNELSYSDFCMLKEVDAKFVTTPDSEIYSGMVKPTNFIDAISSGIEISLGTDSTAWMSTDMFGNMRQALTFARHQINCPAAAGNIAVMKQKLFSRDVFKWATINGAKALGIDHLVGSIVPGKQADIVLLNANHLNMAPVTDPVMSIIMHANSSNVDTVLINGKIKKRGGHLVGVDIDQMIRDLESINHFLLKKCS